MRRTRSKEGPEAMARRVRCERCGGEATCLGWSGRYGGGPGPARWEITCGGCNGGDYWVPLRGQSGLLKDYPEYADWDRHLAHKTDFDAADWADVLSRLARQLGVAELTDLAELGGGRTRTREPSASRPRARGEVQSQKSQKSQMPF